MTEDRITDLEIKYSHLQIEVEKLQNTVFAQDSTIQKQDQALRLLKERLDAFARGDGAVGGGNEKPPHY